MADVAWAVSGSVGLELMVEALPTVVLYKVKAFDLWVAKHFIKSKYISLVNLLADAEVMPEYLTPVDVSGELARWAARWLNDPAERAESFEGPGRPARPGGHPGRLGSCGRADHRRDRGPGRLERDHPRPPPRAARSLEGPPELNPVVDRSPATIGWGREDRGDGDNR